MRTILEAAHVAVGHFNVAELATFAYVPKFMLNRA